MYNYCTVHFIITLFNVDNVLLYVIYQLNFTVFMHATRISRYMTLYTAFGIISVFRNGGWSWNVLPTGNTAVHLYAHQYTASPHTTYPTRSVWYVLRCILSVTTHISVHIH